MVEEVNEMQLGTDIHQLGADGCCQAMPFFDIKNQNPHYSVEAVSKSIHFKDPCQWDEPDLDFCILNYTWPVAFHLGLLELSYV